MMAYDSAEATAAHARLMRVRAAGAAAGADAVVTADRDTVRWLLDGRGCPIDRASQRSPYVIAVTPDAAVVVCPDIEAPRLRAEEEPDRLGFGVVVHPWHESPEAAVSQIVGELRVARDAEVADGLTLARLRLSAAEQARLVELGGDAAAVFEEVIAALHPSQPERAAAASIDAASAARGIFASVVLVAGARRQGLHRHPLPTDEPLGRHALMAATLERHGLHVSLTRIVSFGPPPAALVELVEVAAAVDAALIRASRAGATLGQLLDLAAVTYAVHGFPDEWRHHHQGGPTGYRPREALATPGSELRLEEGMAVAWNPSVTGGAKSEDTILVAGHAPRIVTATPGLPVLDAGRLARPAIVEVDR